MCLLRLLWFLPHVQHSCLVRHGEADKPCHSPRTETSNIWLSGCSVSNHGRKQPFALHISPSVNRRNHIEARRMGTFGDLRRMRAPFRGGHSYRSRRLAEYARCLICRQALHVVRQPLFECPLVAEVTPEVLDCSPPPSGSTMVPF